VSAASLIGLIPRSQDLAEEEAEVAGGAVTMMVAVVGGQASAAITSMLGKTA